MLLYDYYVMSDPIISSISNSGKKKMTIKWADVDGETDTNFSILRWAISNQELPKSQLEQRLLVLPTAS